jgi:hypothetical protein
MRGFVGIAVDFRAAQFRVAGVQVHSMAPRQERQRLVEVRAQFVRRASPARMRTRHRQSPAWLASPSLKAAHIIALPAVQRQRYSGQRAERRFGIDAMLGIGLPRERIGGDAHGWMRGRKPESVALANRIVDVVDLPLYARPAQHLSPA